MDVSKLLDSIHINIHGLRSISNYKPSNFELGINKLIAEHYKNKCDECMQRTKVPEKNNKSEPKFMDKLLGAD